MKNISLTNLLTTCQPCDTTKIWQQYPETVILQKNGDRRLTHCYRRLSYYRNDLRKLFLYIKSLHFYIIKHIIFQGFLVIVQDMLAPVIIGFGT